MDADHRKRDDRLFTITEVSATMRVSERTLRDVIATLGFRRPPGRKRYLFNAAQVALIREAVQCRATIPLAPESEPGSSSSVARLMAANTRAARARETKMLMKRINAELFGASGKAVSGPGKWNRR